LRREERLVSVLAFFAQLRQLHGAVTAAAPGSAQGLYLIVSDIGAARDALLGRGVEISDVFIQMTSGTSPVDR